MKSLAIIAALAVVSTGAQAAEGGQYDGNHLLRACSVVERAADRNLSQREWEQDKDFYACLAYMHAVEATMVFMDELYGRDFPVCYPDGVGVVTMRQMARVFVKYMKAHPEDLHKSAVVLYTASLQEAYPCKTLKAKAPAPDF
ncbi:MAG TPA: Rap1a/Tai family immunity protein [Steroidobacteraceae bacterium]|nr:Rap1a/Tai family immunity protein [Steroidobacteraceae bacterium]